MLYQYKCNSCEEIFEEDLRMSDYDKPMKSPCPYCGDDDCVVRHIAVAPALGYGMNSQVKTSSNFNDRLKEIKENVSGIDGKNSINQQIR